MIIGIECTAHTFGVGVVSGGKILANVRGMYKPKEGGIIPMESAKHHRDVAESIWQEAIEEAGISDSDITAIAVSNAPGLAPCLLAGLEFAKKKALKLSRNQHVRTHRINKSTKGDRRGINIKGDGGGDNDKKTIPLIPVNHCIAHLEIGQHEGAKDPVLLYASGANTQIIAYSAGKYRVFGETLDMGIGNFIDGFARYCGIPFPGGPEIEKKAKQSKLTAVSESSAGLIELPYSIKGMDVSFSGMQTKLKQLYDKGHKIEDLAFSMQEHAFAMLVEAAERALAHTQKKELVLGGGVACNSRLQEMCRIMCKERGAKFFCPSKDLLVDNGAMIAFTGELMMKTIREGKKIIKDKIKEGVRSGKGYDNRSSQGKFSINNIDNLDISPRERTDDVEVRWR